MLATLPQKRGLKTIRNASKRGAPHAPDIATALPLAGCWQLKAGASEKTAEKRPFCSTESGKTNIFWYIQANPKSTNRPPLSEGGGTSLEGVIDPIRYAPQNPPISDKKSPRKRAGTSSRGLFERPKTEIFPGGNPRAEESPPLPPLSKIGEIGCFPLISAVFTESPIWGGTGQDSRFVSTLFPKPLARGLRAVPSFGRLHGLAVLPVWIILSRKPISSRRHKAVSSTLSTQSV